MATPKLSIFLAPDLRHSLGWVVYHVPYGAVRDVPLEKQAHEAPVLDGCDKIQPRHRQASTEACATHES